MTNISFFNLKVVKEKSGRYNIGKKISNPQDIYDVAINVIEIQDQPEESLWMLTLDTKNNITGLFEVSRGTLNSSLAHPREIYKRAVIQNASSIAIIHNHPSGDPAPSSDDVNLTRRIAESGKILGIELLDHIIVGDDKYTSMREKGIM